MHCISFELIPALLKFQHFIFMKRNTLLLFLVIVLSVIDLSAQNTRYWATYYGGSGQEFGNSITTDAAGNVYMTGSTMSSTNISTAGVYQTANAGSADAYIVKFNAAGVRQWGTYFGGADDDLAFGIKTDASGNVYITGYTYSTSGIASPTAYQNTLNGATTRDAFLAKFTPSGGLAWATYYGGELYEQGTSVAVDAGGNVYMAGKTSSTTGIALPGEYQSAFGGGAFDDDGFLVKFDPNGVRLWGTYYGGNSFDVINAVAVDPSGNVVIGGNTMSPAVMASAGAFKTTLTGFPNAFVAKFNPAGSRIWGTYYGDTGPDAGTSIATDQLGNIYLAGTTLSSSNIASGGFQNTFGGGGTTDAFLVKFNSAGNRLWGTYYGGSGEDEGFGVSTDQWNNVFLSGDAYTPNGANIIATPNGFQTNISGSENAFLASITPNGNRITSTYYGALHEENGLVAAAPTGAVYLAGSALASSGITSGGHQNAYGGAQDAYLVKFSANAVHWEVIVPNDTVPPTPTTAPPKIYIGVAIFDLGNIHLSNATLKNFSPGAPLPATGSSFITFTCDFEADYSNSGPPVHISCPATCTMKVTYLSNYGTTRNFDTEILQLDIAGGSLPSDVIFRESPVLQSKGELSITPLGLYYKTHSFFDLHMEVSLTNGADWLPSDPSLISRIDLQDGVQAAIPTLSEWGLISMGVLLLIGGLTLLKQRA